jgi:hypothetical protein
LTGRAIEGAPPSEASLTVDFVIVGAGMVGRRGAAGLGGSGVSACWGVAIAITTWVQGETTPWLDSTQSHRTQLRR